MPKPKRQPGSLFVYIHRVEQFFAACSQAKRAWWPAGLDGDIQIHRLTISVIVQISVISVEIGSQQESKKARKIGDGQDCRYKEDD